jgi:carboxymethylenebutenolidase
VSAGASPPGSVTDPRAVEGEDVSYPGAGGDRLNGYLARPTAPGPHAGLIVIHEAFGLNEHIRDVARRFANVGYTALAPDLYSREGRPPAADDFAAIMALMQSVHDGRTVADLEGAAALLGSQQGASGRIGCIGFCSGGRQTLLFACSSPVLSAAVDCWGGSITRANPNQETTRERPVPVVDMLDRLACPLMLAVGAEDQNPSPEHADLVRERLADSQLDVRIDVYEDAGHAFFADYRPQYKEAAAHRLWERVVEFLATHLRGNTSG